MGLANYFSALLSDYILSTYGIVNSGLVREILGDAHSQEGITGDHATLERELCQFDAEGTANWQLLKHPTDFHPRSG